MRGIKLSQNPHLFVWLMGAICLLLALVFPFIVDRPRFWLPNIGVRTMWLGIIAMSMVFLNRFVGLLSLAQVAVAGTSAYGIGFMVVKQGSSFGIAAIVGVLAGTVAAMITAVIAVRTKAIYFLMITLAMSQALYSWVGQAIEITNARRGLAPIPRPTIFGIDLNDITSFYYFSLAIALLCLACCYYLGRSNFGLTLQGIRDSPERMKALGYRVNRHRTLAVTFAGFIASVGGIVMVLDHAQIDPDSVSLNATLDVLIVAVIGGVGSLGGVFIGGLLLTLLTNFGQNFTSYYISAMGGVFILVLYFAPTGVAGLSKDLVRRFIKGRTQDEATKQMKGHSNEADK